MAFTASFGDLAGYSHVAKLAATTLADAKREFHRSRGRFGGLRWVRFTEVLPQASAFDAALGKSRVAATSFHVLLPN